MHCYFVAADREDSLGLKPLQPPTLLQSDELSAVSALCWTVSITAYGHLICRTPEGIHVLDRDTLNSLRSVMNTDTTDWREIIQPEGVMVASCYNWKEGSAEVAILCPNSLKKLKCLYQQSVGKVTTYSIAQHLSLIYIVDREEKQLVVCNVVDNTIQKLSVPRMKNPQPVCMLPDSTLVIADRAVDGGVSRFKLENTALTQMWVFPHISEPTAISFDPTFELIYICTRDGPLLILSLEGEEILCLF